MPSAVRTSATADGNGEPTWTTWEGRKVPLRIDHIDPELLPLAVPVKSLKLDPQNARLHPPRNIDEIKESLCVFSQRSPLIVRRETRVVAKGNGGLMAVRALGWTKIAASVQSMTDAEFAGYALADNRTGESSSWDVEMVARLQKLHGESANMMVGWSSRDLVLLRAADWEQPIDVAAHDDGNLPKVQEIAITRQGDVWSLGEHRISCCNAMDSESVHLLLDGTKVDCVFTSPPYGIGADYTGYEDSIDNLRELLPKAAKIWQSLITPGGYAVIDFADLTVGEAATRNGSPCEYPMALEYWPVFRDAGYSLWSRRVWCRRAGSVSSMHCISSNRAAAAFVHLWTWKTEGQAIIRKQVELDDGSSSTWGHLQVDDGTLGIDHPAVMPISVASYSIAWHSRKGAAVYDPFLGSGTSLLAAHQLGRRFFGTDIDPRYVDLTIRRWRELTGEDTVRQDGTLFSRLENENSQPV